MDSINVENLKCFKNTGDIELKPLTITVGKNSSGKSTIARIFPLFKQTLETRRSEPILWYGRYVDFGGYNESKSNFESSVKTINFSFNFNTDIHCFGNEVLYGILPFLDETDKIQNARLKVKLFIGKDDIKEVHIRIFDVNIELILNKNKQIAELKINNHSSGKINVEYDEDIDYIIPRIISNNSELTFLRFKTLLNYEKSFKESLDNDKLIVLIKKILDKCNLADIDYLYTVSLYEYLIKNELNFEQKYEKIKSFLLKKSGKPKGLICHNDNYKKISMETVSSIIKEIELNKEQISIYIIEFLMPNIIDACNSYLSDYFKNVKYIAPVRATAERYYRKQGLNVQEVDARGENVPMILQNMSIKEQERFNEWLDKNFGFKIVTKVVEEHVSVKLLTGKMETNIADTGFGYSQIIPILLILWKSINSKNASEVQIVVEQPELHLHPKMQVQLLKVILNVIAQNKNIKFLLETHSETLINQLGLQIENKMISADDINILLIEQPNKQDSYMRPVHFNQDGYIEDWPIDFFEED